MKPGEIIKGRFRVVREIGRGGFGAVFEAELIGPPGGLVALKVLDLPPKGSTDFEVRFLREVKNAQRIEHPHAIGVYEVGSLEDGRFFYSMELCHGRSLKEILAEQGPLEPARAARLMAQSLAALGSLHAIGMVHRDIKPDTWAWFIHGRRGRCTGCSRLRRLRRETRLTNPSTPPYGSIGIAGA